MELVEALEKYREVIKVWSEGTDPFKRALAETVIEAANEVQV